MIKILFHSLSHSVPLPLSKSHSIWSSHPFPKLSQALILSQSLSSLTVTLSSSLIHRRRPDPAVPSHSQNSPSLSSLTITLSSSLIHRYLPNPTVLSYRSPHTHAADRLRPTPPTHPFCHPSTPTLCLFVIGDFFYFVCDWWLCLVWVEEKNWRFEFFIYLFFLLWTGGGGGGGCGCGCGW